MSDIQDYPSRLNNPDTEKYETYSYLPAFTDAQVNQQIERIVEKGWNPCIEHVEPERASTNYWYMWKLPMFGEKSVKRILSEIEACKKANPGNHVKLIGYDNKAQSQGLSFVVYRAR